MICILFALLSFVSLHFVLANVNETFVVYRDGTIWTARYSLSQCDFSANFNASAVNTPCGTVAYWRAPTIVGNPVCEGTVTVKQVTQLNSSFVSAVASELFTRSCASDDIRFVYDVESHCLSNWTWADEDFAVEKYQCNDRLFDSTIYRGVYNCAQGATGLEIGVYQWYIIGF
jgi:hypothetical protein